jgi:hypothetical protein
MKFGRHRRYFAGAVAVALVASGVVGSQLGTAASAPTVPDTIQYSQTTGSNGTYILYTPGDGSKTTKQSVTSGGGCATPTPSGAPLLGFSASYYSSGYNGTASPAVVGAYKSRTGVCQIPQAWSIEKNEALKFAVGSNSLVAGRVFSRAQIKLEREDKSTLADAPVQGRLVTRLGATIVDQSKTFSINGPAGTQVTADTGLSTTGFDSVEIRVESPDAGSISVVGPTSTFTFASKICVGDTITTNSSGGSASAGQVAASVTLAGVASGPTCKSYTFFGASASDPNSTDGKSISFLSQQVIGAHITATFDWGYTPYCRADATTDSVPTCPTTYVNFGDGTGDHAQTYCAAADPGNTALPWCTTSRNFEYKTVHDPTNPAANAAGDVVVTHITETWDGYGDIYFHR